MPPSQVSAISHLTHDEVSTVNSSGDTALHLAAEHNRASVIESLLKHGASLEAKNTLGFTALQIAAIKCHKHCLEVSDLSFGFHKATAKRLPA